VLPVDKTLHNSGRGKALSCCGNQGDTTNSQASWVLTIEGRRWASPTVDYLGPGQSSVIQHHRDSGVAGFTRLLLASCDSEPLVCNGNTSRTLAAVSVVNLGIKNIRDVRFHKPVTSGATSETRQH
jgi:hypothetical protein